MSLLRSGVKRKRVALAGLGVVGGGVYERLRRHADRFEIVGVVCRDPARLENVGAPADLHAKNVAALAEFDILVEAIGGLEAAGEIVFAALARGADVVTANKTLVSRRFADIEDAAAEAGSQVLYSAAVGGGVPMLETVDEIAGRREIVSLEAVLNGTTNFVLDRLGAGASFEAAVRQAQDAGFAEADPSADIDGIDAAEKLSLLTRRAFRVNIDPANIAADRLLTLSPDKVTAAARAGAPFKQVASAVVVAEKLRFDVRLRQIEADNPLARPKLEENCLVIACADGHRRVLHGKGAGREPTSESVFSDIARLAPSGAATNGGNLVNANNRVNESARAPLRY